MPKITPLQESLYDIVPSINNINPDEKYESLRNFANKKQLFAGQTALSEEVIQTLLLEPISDPETKSELTAMLSDPINLSALQNLVTDHSEHINHLLYGYKKLKTILRIEQKIAEHQTALDQLNMSQYVSWSSMEHADFKTIRKSQKISDIIAQLETEKADLLSNKEIVAAYEHHKLATYAQALQAGKLVQTPSVQATKSHLRDQILAGKTLLLSWPVGTGKTKMAIEIYQEILQAKKKAGGISEEDYKKLAAIPIVNGNEESSIRDLQTRPTQMSNKTDTDQAFIYDEGHLTLCLKYGLPLIIDEANRTPPNFLSSLKKYWAFKAGDLYRDPTTGDTFPIQWPLQVLMTANEGSKYSAHTNKFQDQIEREVQREYIWYLPSNEIYDIFKAKLYLEPGIAYVAPEDLTTTLSHLVDFAMEVNQLYLSGAPYTFNGDITAHKIKSTVLDTKRLLALVDRSKIWSKATFREEINTSLVDFISRIENDNDRKILCQIAYSKKLLSAENISDLWKWSGLDQATDFSFITIKKETVDSITGDRIVDPWELATAWVPNFEKLDFGDEGSILKGIASDINKLDLFSPLQNNEITTLLWNLQKSDLETVFPALLSKLEAENSEKIAQVRKIASQAKALNSNIPALFDTWLAEHKIEEEQVETPQEPAVSQLETKNMSAIEQERKAASYEYLKANNMDTSENRKLIEAVRFGSNYVEVWGIKFSNEKLKPQNSKRKAKNKHEVYPSSTKGLRKTEYNGQEEYYYDLDAYKAECKTQNKTPLMKEDFEEALKALPGEYKERNWYEGGKILSLLLWMSMSGYVDSDGDRWLIGKYGYLGSASSSGSYRRSYNWNVTKGILNYYNTYNAFPSLFRL